ncbi:MAG: hypothetical protein JSW39_02715 [Desulfobacterales bacterium]|nr:MAG: hypothetical protein JSW39_02715 [Desulfobacterales bacterium]
MDVKSYCDSVEAELTAWKAKLYGVMRKSDSLPTAEKAQLAPMIQELNSIVDDLDQRIELLAKECPAEWHAHKNGIEGKMAQVKDKWKNVWGAMGEPDYGIGGA